MQFIFAIYSCKKNLDIKTKLLHTLLKNKLNHCKIYIIYGDETLSTDYEIIDNNYLVLKCGDLYENLSQKTLCLFSTIAKIHPEVKGVFKCDDDILPNIKKINELIDFVLHSDYIPYLGFRLEHHCDFYYDESIHKMTHEKYKKPLLAHRCIFTGGPFYYLSMDSVCKLNNMPIVHEIMQDPIDYMFEDDMIGYLLNQHDIFPVDYKTYFDEISDYRHGCVQNIDNRIRNLYVYIHGGFGNQLFQIAMGFELAKKHNRFLILLYRTNDIVHNTSVTEFFSTIFSEFNYIDEVEVDLSRVIKCQEDKCFDYYPNIIEHPDYDYYLRGYFQNKRYLDVYKPELLQMFCEYRNKAMDGLFEKYPYLHNSYFIHIRRGDYIGHPLYTFDVDTYINVAISYILKKEKDQTPHFYIFSNDIGFCKTYPVLENIEKTFIEDLDTLGSFYSMSLCRKGGICANSTFSGWATMLNDNPEKTVIVPKNWINFDYPYEIPFDYTVSF